MSKARVADLVARQDYSKALDVALEQLEGEHRKLTIIVIFDDMRAHGKHFAASFKAQPDLGTVDLTDALDVEYFIKDF